jgi:crotonobetainyl-CoA:carnitine CoA-transferase CaiB-like acyl-CoA transferase
VHNANKRSAVLDLDGPDFARLVARAAILVHDRRPGQEGALADERLLGHNPRLVVVAVSDFGRTGPYRDWAATDEVLLALNGALARSGRPGLAPLPPPAAMAGASAATQAAWAALVGYAEAAASGRGEVVDVSLHEASAQAIDPGFGIAGSATGGARAIAARGRPDVAHLYPIFPCADGKVRICVLSPRQWRGMRAWLGEPAELADPQYELLHIRFGARELIHPLIERLFADRTRDELVAEGQKLGVPVAGLLEPAEALTAEQFVERGVFAPVAVGPGRTVRVPDTAVELDGRRAGVRRPAPGPGEHTADVLAELAADAPPGPAGRRLDGLRVLDLGVIVVGAEMGRLFADQGADVIKIESREFPDGGRQATADTPITPSFVWGHRGKRSLGLNLRSPEGKRLFLDLVARADVVLTNFKPGTMDSLGFGHAELAAVNPDIVVVDSSAFGPTGPWSARMGYGPLVRAATGLCALWRHPGPDGGFGDAATVYPDHVAGRLGALAALAAVLGRRGARVSVSQAEVILGQQAEVFVLESERPGSGVEWATTGPDAPRGPYPCAGDDEWCVVAVRDDADWRRLCAVLERPDLATDPEWATTRARRAHRTDVDDLVGAWTRQRGPREAMTTLQEAGVPAGMMQRLADHADDPQLRARGHWRLLVQPQLGEVLPTENGPATYRALAEPRMRPAPLPGEQTAEVMAEVLGLDAARIAELVEQGVLEPHPGP